MKKSLANRILSAEVEPLSHFGPLFGIFNWFDKDSPPAFSDAVKEILTSIRDETIPLSDASGGPDRKSNVITQIEIASEIAFDAAKDMKRFVYKSCLLSVDQIAAIHLFTQEPDLEMMADSVYALINSALSPKP